MKNSKQSASSKLTEAEELELIALLEQEVLEQVIPKLEVFRHPARYKLAHGGRGSGKSHGFASLLLQELEHSTLKLLCTREVQNSLAESSYQLIVETLDKLQYKGWRRTLEYIENTKNGSRIIFRGLKDLRAAEAVKSMEGIDRCWIEEAASVSAESLKILIPTIRKPGSEIWASWNRITETDPIWEYTKKEGAVVVQANYEDNPWFPDVLRAEMEADFKNDPDEAEHVWHGQPRKQGLKSVLARVAIRHAMERTDVPDEGVEELGIDVARFGDDKTTIYHRRGYKVIARRKYAKQDTQFIARAAWDMINRNPAIRVKVDDTGVGGGVTDKLKDLGAKVVPVNFGGAPKDKRKFTTAADEMWFTFPIDKVSLPEDSHLMEELAGRQYAYTSDDRRKIESKDQFKKRIGRSPDDADGLILCFYEAKESLELSPEDLELMARRYQ